MSSPPSNPDPAPLSTYVADGARIAGILGIWGAFAAFFGYGLTEFGVFGRLFANLGSLFALTGVLNAVLYMCYRSVDYWQASA
jgi:hypothetical protein